MQVVNIWQHINFLVGRNHVAKAVVVKQDKFIFLIRGVSGVSLVKKPLNYEQYTALGNNVFELSPLWALYFFLQTDTSHIPDNNPQISVTDQDSTAEIAYTVGSKAIKLKFNNIHQPD